MAENVISNLPLNKRCWMRQIKVKLISRKPGTKPLIYGYDDKKDRSKNINQLNIAVSIDKKLSALEDNGVCTISNLTYAELARLITGDYKGIEIYAGYANTGMQMFFKGEIAYISNKIQEKRTHTAYIVFASAAVARYSQRLINLNLNSGINLYAAFKYIFLTNGISENHLPLSLKKVVLNEITSNYGTLAGLSEQLINNTEDFSISADSTDSNVILDISNTTDKRRIKINPNTINFTKGNPTLSSDGLIINIMPTFAFKTGDIIYIDNRYIDLSENTLSGVRSNYKFNYLDESGAYVIVQMRYSFQNRGSEFNVEIRARALKHFLGKSLLGE